MDSSTGDYKKRKEGINFPRYLNFGKKPNNDLLTTDSKWRKKPNLTLRLNTITINRINGNSKEVDFKKLLNITDETERERINKLLKAQIESDERKEKLKYLKTQTEDDEEEDRNSSSGDEMIKDIDDEAEMQIKEKDFQSLQEKEGLKESVEDVLKKNIEKLSIQEESAGELSKEGNNEDFQRRKNIETCVKNITKDEMNLKNEKEKKPVIILRKKKQKNN